MMGLGFLFEKKILARLKRKTTFALMCIVMKTNWLFQFTFQIKNLKIQWSWKFNEDKSHYVYIKDFDRFMFQKTKNEDKICFCKSCLQRFSSKNVLTEHKEDCWSINGAQSVRLKKWTIEFKNYFKQIPVPFKVFADFEYNLESVETYEGSYWKRYKDHIPCSFAYKFLCVDNKFTKPIVAFRGETAAYELIKTILQKYEYCKKVTKKHFNKFDHEWGRRRIILIE